MDGFSPDRSTVPPYRVKDRWPTLQGAQRLPSFGIWPQPLLSHLSEIISIAASRLPLLPTPVAVTRCGPTFQAEPPSIPGLGLLIRTNKGPYLSLPGWDYS
jgi:hypothetical protein